MGYYSWSVRKATQPEGEETWEVTESGPDGSLICIDSIWANEVDARAACYFNEALEKHGNITLAELATGKWLEKNGLVPVNLHVAYFDEKVGKVNFTRAIQGIWESL
jgi:hypothetical protein